MKFLLALFCQEVRLQVRQKNEWASLILFFLIVVILMPFALGPEPDILHRLAPGLIWVAALLMSLLSLDRLFVQDARDGMLDEMLTSPQPLELIVAAKLLAQIFILLAVLLTTLPVAALLLDLDAAALPHLLLAFLLGIPSLVLIGGIAGAVTVTLHRNAALLTLLAIPFYIPILIFAVSACGTGPAVTQNLLFLGAFLALLLPSAPLIIASSLRLGQE